MANALGYLALCVVWGTTYLAIKIALEGTEPFFMAGTRFLAASLLLVPVFFRKSASLPRTRKELGAIVVSGILMITGGNGLVTLSEVWLNSGITALSIAIGPAFTALVGGWFFTKDERYGKYAIYGTVIAIAGVVVLHHNRLSLQHAELPGVIAALSAPICWSVGSLIARNRIRHTDALSTTAIQMFVGCLTMLLISQLRGETWHADLTPRVVWAWLYLVFIGSSFIYAIYVWLLKRMPTSRVLTYSYVNPVIALIAGRLFLGEPITGEVIPATILILGGLLLIYFLQHRDQPAIAGVREH